VRACVCPPLCVTQVFLLLFKQREISQLTVKIVAACCQIIRLKRIKFYFGWASAPKARWESLQLDLRGYTARGMETEEFQNVNANVNVSICIAHYR